MLSTELGSALGAVGVAIAVVGAAALITLFFSKRGQGLNDLQDKTISALNATSADQAREIDTLRERLEAQAKQHQVEVGALRQQLDQQAAEIGRLSELVTQRAEVAEFRHEANGKLDALLKRVSA